MNFDTAIAAAEAEAQVKHYTEDDDPDAHAETRAWATREIDKLVKLDMATRRCSYTDAFHALMARPDIPHLKRMYASN